MYEHILIPTDGSKGARRGVEHGLDLAAEFDATVHVLYVVDEEVYGETPALSSDELIFDRLEEQGEEIVEAVGEEAKQRGLDVETRVVRGEPHRCITDYAEERDVDVIVMGRHGSAAHGHPHIGSVTDRVMRTTPTPILPV